MKSITYRVRQVTRHIVTRYTSDNKSGFCEEMGEFDNEAKASNAVLAFGDSETVSAKPPNFVFTVRPNTPPGHEQERKWERGVGWDDLPNCDGVETNGEIAPS